ncbi:hypothetical protein IWW36_004203 [Coemansia brasiliensis]|uniref:Replication factor A C-terminal domain-containing protein n=1 Tax=Coemansia brasiliensis TaxID=2650707 RepID=A0A9W8IA63_9FUNG|nr:hypothetical protein IWW36_004203 [Coemansia brasiliensis]
MSPQLVQILRLPVLSSAGSHGVSGQPSSAGLNLVFPACPSCAHKAEINHAGWVCTHCHLELQTKDICWKYRLRFSAVTAQGSCEFAASVLGSAADPWFGCSASQWVDEVDWGLQTLAQCRNEAVDAELSDRMENRLAAAIGLIFGAFGHHVFVDMRKAPSVGRTRYPIQYSVTRIIPFNVASAIYAQSTFVNLLMLWKYVVYEAVLAAVFSKDECLSYNIEQSQLLHSLEAGIQDIAAWNGLSAAQTIVTTSDVSDIHSMESNEQIAAADLLDNWDHIFETHNESVETQEDDKAYNPTAEFNDSQIDEILNNSSQLFIFDSSSIGKAEAHETSLSMQFFEESLHDEHIHSLVLDSQQQLHCTNSQVLTGDEFDDFGDSYPLSRLSDLLAEPFDFTPSCALLQDFRVTPRSASQSSWLATPHMLSNTPSGQEALPADYSRRFASMSEGKTVLVLAEETPKVNSGGFKRKLEFSVPETPLAARSGSSNSNCQNLQLSIRKLSRSASLDATKVVPETPTIKHKFSIHASQQDPSTVSALVKRHSERYRPLLMTGGASRSNRSSKTRLLSRKNRRNLSPRPSLGKIQSETAVEPHIKSLKLQNGDSFEASDGNSDSGDSWI